MKSNGLPGVVYKFPCSDFGPVRPMITLRLPESPEHGLGRNAGRVGDVDSVQGLLETSPDAMLESSTVAPTRAAVRKNIIIIQIICLFMLTPQILLKKEKKLQAFSA
jgi:hypothetical protein